MLATRAWVRPAHGTPLAAGLFRSRSGRVSAMAAQKRPRTTARAETDAEPPDSGASELDASFPGFGYAVCHMGSFETRAEAFRAKVRTNALRTERLPRASFVPSLAHDARKGQAGRVAVVGGCEEYTGAPFFAAVSALKTGCDVVHVFCTESAAPVIKSYSPEIIAHPYVFARSAEEDRAETSAAKSDAPPPAFDDGVRKTTRWLKNMDAVVVGPGLGRDPYALAFAREILAFARKENLPAVVDADGLYLVSLDPDVVRGNANAVLTPNAAELGRLTRSVLGESEARALTDPRPGDTEEDGGVPSAARERIACRLSEALRGAAILSKGSVDLGACSAKDEGPIVTDFPNAHVVAWCAVREGGSPRRCGGQGDVLAGSLATFLAWASIARRARARDVSLAEPKPSPRLCPAEKVSAMAHAARVTRDAARAAFEKKKRAATASDVVEEMGEAFEARFPADRASYASSEERERASGYVT